jgi:hypothetical protein
MRAQAVVRIVLCATAVVAGATGTARASCGISDIPAATAAALSGRLSPPPSHAPAAGPANGSGVEPSIIGLWHTTFSVDVDGSQVPIQEAFQLWNAGGTEVHNPNVDPRQGNVCLGVWAQVAPRAFKLTHRVWAWNTSGGFEGTLHLSETLTLGNGGYTFSGTFTLDVYDPSENLVAEIGGTATGERISVGDQ